MRKLRAQVSGERRRFRTIDRSAEIFSDSEGGSSPSSSSSSAVPSPSGTLSGYPYEFTGVADGSDRRSSSSSGARSSGAASLDYYAGGGAERGLSPQREESSQQQRNFDLDLSYVTSSVIAMAIPAKGGTVAARFYRNCATDVVEFLEREHPHGCWLVFGLTETLSAGVYDSNKLSNNGGNGGGGGGGGGGTSKSGKSGDGGGSDSKKAYKGPRAMTRRGSSAAKSLLSLQSSQSQSQLQGGQTGEDVLDFMLAERVMHFPFLDHHAPPLSVLLNALLAVDRWLSADRDNVAVLHCRGGKGRTGTICAGLLLMQGFERTADSAFRHFARARGSAVTQPSQRRCVQVMERLLKLSREDLDARQWRGMEGMWASLDNQFLSHSVIENIRKEREGQLNDEDDSSSDNNDGQVDEQDSFVAAEPLDRPSVRRRALPRFEVTGVRVFSVPPRWRKRKKRIEAVLAEYAPMGEEAGGDEQPPAISVLQCNSATTVLDFDFVGTGLVFGRDVVIRVRDSKKELFHVIFHVCFLAEATAAPATPGGDGALLLEFCGRGEIDAVHKRFGEDVRVSVQLKKVPLDGTKLEEAREADAREVELWQQVIDRSAVLHREQAEKQKESNLTFAQADVEFLRLNPRGSGSSRRVWEKARIVIQRGILRIEIEQSNDENSLVFPVFRGVMADVKAGKSLGLSLTSGAFQLRFSVLAEYYAVFGVLANDCGEVTRHETRSLMDMRLLKVEAEALGPSAGRAAALAEIQVRLDLLAEEVKAIQGFLDGDNAGPASLPVQKDDDPALSSGATAVAVPAEVRLEELRERLCVLEEMSSSMEGSGAATSPKWRALADLEEEAKLLRDQIRRLSGGKDRTIVVEADDTAWEELMMKEERLHGMLDQLAADPDCMTDENLQLEAELHQQLRDVQTDSLSVGPPGAKGRRRR